MVENSTDRFNGVIMSLAIKAPCVVGSNIVDPAPAGNLVLYGEQTVNGTAVVSGDRVLVMSQTNAVENGIWVVSSTEWDRAADWDGNRDVHLNTLVVAGTTGAAPIMYRVTTPLPITIGSTAVNFAPYVAASDVVMVAGDIFEGDDNSTTVPIFTDSNLTVQILDPSLSQIIDILDDYTFTLADKGKTASLTGTASGVVVTVPAAASVDYRHGTFLAVNNDGTNDLTITVTTDTLTWAADNTTGDRTIAPGGYAVMQKVAGGNWKIAGKQIS